MRKQTRPPKPDILVQHGDRWSQQWANLREQNPAAAFQWYEVEGRSSREWLLPVLREMTQGHCAFCDAYPLEDRSKEPIEHFKPKHEPQFHSDAYAWENLFYACEFCQGEKQGQWDDGLLKPDADDYAFEKYFQFDFTTGELKPNAVVSESDQLRASVTIKMYGLDHEKRRRFRRLELRKWSRKGQELDDWAYRDFLEGASNEAA